MATIESITKRLDDLEKGHSYFSIEEIVMALEREKEGESFLEALHRECPGKTFHPDLVSHLLEKPTVGGSE